MKKECSNAATERILALLILLLHGEHSRNDIFMSIETYERGATADSQHKMFDRDVSTLERVGIHVERHYEQDDILLYSIPMEQFSKDRSLSNYTRRKEHSNASTERVLTLFFLLLHDEYSRDDILLSIAGYRRGATPPSQQKMFERDLSTLEHVGIYVEWQFVKKGWILYSVPLEQFSKDSNMPNG